MRPPPVHYVTTSDGYNIAYGVSGEGVPLVFLPGAFDHIQLAWQFPGIQSWLEGLADSYRLVQLDPRGAGMSTRGLKDDHAVAEYQLDIEAVVDELKLERFVLLGVAHGAERAVHYAANHPDRVMAVIVGTSGPPNSHALFEMIPAEDWDAFLYSVVPRGTTPDDADRQVRMKKQAYGQHDAVLRMRVSMADDIDDLLKSMRTPMLLLHARNYPLTPPEEAMRKAQLSGAPLVLIDGSTPYGDATEGILAIKSFLAGLDSAHVTPPPEPLGLSARQVEVLRLMAAGLSNQQIADELVISLNTVQHHVSHILTKTSLANRTEAASYAYRNKLV